MAEIYRKKLIKTDRLKVRECLKCGLDFPSYHQQNRICDRCAVANRRIDVDDECQGFVYRR